MTNDSAKKLKREHNKPGEAMRIVCLLLTLLFSQLVWSVAVTSSNLELNGVAETLMTEYQLPSVSLALGRDEVVVFTEAVGYADINRRISATTKTQYSVASIAKPMTAMAMLKLVSQNNIALSDSVGKYINLDSDLDDITLGQLASHTSGIAHVTEARYALEFEDPTDHASPQEVLFTFTSEPLLFEHGSAFHYSSNGYILLSAVMELATKKSFMKLLNDTVFVAFDMTSTTLDISKSTPNEASYYMSYEAEKGYSPSPAKRDRSFLFGAGGFLSTPSDMVKFARSTYDHNFLKKEPRNLIYAPATLSNASVSEGSYSIGWQVGTLTLEAGRDVIKLTHAGLVEGAAAAYLVVVPQCKQSLSFATNYAPNNIWKIYDKLDKLLKENLDTSLCDE